MFAFLGPSLLDTVSGGLECAAQFAAPLLQQSGSLLPIDADELRHPLADGFACSVGFYDRSPWTQFCAYKSCGFAGRQSELQTLVDIVEVRGSFFFFFFIVLLPFYNNTPCWVCLAIDVLSMPEVTAELR